MNNDQGVFSAQGEDDDTKHTAVIIHIIYFITNLILMARSEAEGI